MVSANKNIFLPSLKVLSNLKIFCFILICILCIYILVLSGCCFRLFEIQQMDETKIKSANEEIKEKKIKDKDKKKMHALVDVLRRRSQYEKIKRVRDKKGDHYFRYDLECFINEEWPDGWKYLQHMPMAMYASDLDGRDGILVPKEVLPVFDPGAPIVNSTNWNPGVKLSFIHLSDVQLRDERVYMFSEELTRFLDYFSDGFDHDQFLVMYDHSYYLTLTGVMMLLNERLQPEALRPKFMIHTGDVAHMGVVSEHYEFIYITNNLKIPWYNVLGNHDYPVYGNLTSDDVGVIDPNMGFQTLSSRYNFINMHGMGYEIDPMVYLSPSNAPHRLDNATDQPDNDPDPKRSIYNGFDMEGAESLVHGDKTKPCKICPENQNANLNEDNAECKKRKPCKECPGYYHFEALQPQGGNPGMLVVVIDTSVKDFHFAKGSVCRDKNAAESKDKDKCDREQIDWLDNVLEKYANEGHWMVLAFGHHPLNRESFCDESYKEVTDLFNNPRYNVIAYFCGHTHKHRVKYHRNEDYPGSFGFWEITTDSIMEYPKKGSLVNIVYTDEKYWAIRLQSFWPYFLKDVDINDPAIPEMLKHANICFNASQTDDEGSKKKRYDILPAKHHDAVLPFSFPKSSKE